MTQIENEVQYAATLARIEELLPLVTDESSETCSHAIELKLLSHLIADYDELHFPIAPPTLVEVLKLRMYEMNLTQKSLAALLNISPSRVSEYLTGKSEPTLKVAREMHRKLAIDAHIILGV